MWNIIRAQWYQLIRDRRVRGAFIVMLLFNAAIAFVNMDGYEEIKGGRFMADLGGFFCVMGLVFMVVLTAFVMGTDFEDKTLYYEILAGHSRKEVFFGRFLVALCAGCLGATVITFFCPLLLAGIYGWGDIPDMASVFLRYLLMLGVWLRIIGETALIAVAVKSPYATIFAGYIIGCVEFLLLMLKSLIPLDTFLQFLSVIQCMVLMQFESGQGTGDAAEQALWWDGLPGHQWIPIVVIGLAAAGTAAAYAYFKRDDLQ